MRRSDYLRFGVLVSLWFAITMMTPCSVLAQDCEQWVAKMVSVQGTVELKKAGDSQWQPVQLNDTYCPGDTIRVSANSRADLALVNQATLRLKQNSEITLQGLKEKKTSLIDMFSGAAHFFSRSPRGMEVRTRFAIAGVRGTEFFVSAEEDRTFVSVFEGSVLAANEAGNRQWPKRAKRR